MNTQFSAATLATCFAAFLVGFFLMRVGRPEPPTSGHHSVTNKTNYGHVLRFKIAAITPAHTTGEHRYLQLKLRRWYGKIDQKAYAIRQNLETQEINILFPAAPDATARVGDILDYRLIRYISDEEEKGTE